MPRSPPSQPERSSQSVSGSYLHIRFIIAPNVGSCTGESYAIIMEFKIMQKLTTVEEAKALMKEAQDWSVFHWLLEKGRVRATADRATDALAELELQVKRRWPAGLRKEALEKLRKADQMAETARLDAEATFEEAERRLSSALAREGAQKAIHSW